MSAYQSVREFERRVAEFTGAKYGIATDSCTSALFLACKYVRVKTVMIPAKTYISVAAAIIHAGGSVDFRDIQWAGEYRLEPYDIWDCALRFKRGMYHGGYACLSFQARKSLPIGKGGMILTDDDRAAQWFVKARSNGRNIEVPYEQDDIDMLGWNFSMTPEQGARGLQLLETLQKDLPDQQIAYPDLRTMPVFQQCAT